MHRLLYSVSEFKFDLLFNLGLTVFAQKSDRVFTISLAQVRVRELVLAIRIVVCEDRERLVVTEALRLLGRRVYNLACHRGCNTAEVGRNLELNGQLRIVVELEA